MIRTLLPIACLAILAPGGAAARGAGGLTPGDRDELRRHARATWRAMAAMAQPSGLPADRLTLGRGGQATPSDTTSPTDIAAYLWSVLAVERMGIIDRADADARLDRTLATLAPMRRPRGFFLNGYETGTGDVPGPGKLKGRPPHFLSTVDNGWLAAALMMVRNARPDLRRRVDDLLGPMDFAFFYEPFDPADPIKHPGQLHGGYRLNAREFTPFYGMINTEPRIASYVAIARGQVPPEHYYRIYRTLPERGMAQQSRPEGETRTYRGVPVFEGHYTVRGLRIVPSWGGSMFEALMVPLLVPEAEWAPASWGVNHPLYVRAQIEHGLEVRRYGVWGFSPAEDPAGGYRTFGVDALGAATGGYRTYDPPRDRDAGPPAESGPVADGVVTPHASFLALRFAPREAMDNLRTLARRFPDLEGPYGFRDSVDVSSGRVADAVLALDQGMILAAIADALDGGCIQRLFCDGEVERAIRPLIAPEHFTAGPR